MVVPVAINSSTEGCIKGHLHAQRACYFNSYLAKGSAGVSLVKRNLFSDRNTYVRATIDC